MGSSIGSVYRALRIRGRRSSPAACSNARLSSLPCQRSQDLLDKPFGALDNQTRMLIQEIWKAIAAIGAGSVKTTWK
jgi:hypothetical protein